VTILLGGAASPIGWSVQFVDVPARDLLDELVRWRTGLGHRTEVSSPRPYPDVLEDLTPFESPWTRELVLPCGDRWSAYLNNGRNGGDPTASAHAVAARLDARRVMGMHAPRHGPGHQSTQLWVHGPGGEGPSQHVRTLTADAADGRWSWYALGEPFDFEDTDRYTARRVRDRFDRSLLLRYLAALGIPADDDASYGPGVIVQELVDHPVHRETLEEARRSLAP